MTDEKKSVGLQVIQKAPRNGNLIGPIEINQHVAQEDRIESARKRISGILSYSPILGQISG